MAKIHYTKEQVNLMRKTKTDVQVAKDICLEKNSITRIYWTRASNKLPYLWEWKSRKRDIKVEIVEELPRSWKDDTRTAKHVEYWDTSDTIQIGMNPAWFTKFNQNSLWKNS